MKNYAKPSYRQTKYERENHFKNDFSSRYRTTFFPPPSSEQKSKSSDSEIGKKSSSDSIFIPYIRLEKTKSGRNFLPLFQLRFHLRNHHSHSIVPGGLEVMS